MVPSSSEDVARALRGQPRLSRNCLRRNGGNVIVVVLISFNSRDVFSAFSRPSSAGLSFVVYSFGCSLFRRLFRFKKFNQANFTDNGNEYNSCVSVRYNSLFISLAVVYKRLQDNMK